MTFNNKALSKDELAAMIRAANNGKHTIIKSLGPYKSQELFLETIATLAVVGISAGGHLTPEETCLNAKIFFEGLAIMVERELSNLQAKPYLKETSRLM